MYFLPLSRPLQLTNLTKLILAFDYRDNSQLQKSLASFHNLYQVVVILSFNLSCHQLRAPSTNFKGNYAQAVNIFSEPKKLLFWTASNRYCKFKVWCFVWGFLFWFWGLVFFPQASCNCIFLKSEQKHKSRRYENMLFNWVFSRIKTLPV